MTSPSWESTSTGLRRWLPILQWLPQYNRSWLRVDVIAGLTVVALIVPDGMAYAQLAGMPPETALYGAWIALVIAIKQVPKRLGPFSGWLLRFL